jgi:hypothetical protein
VSDPLCWPWATPSHNFDMVAEPRMSVLSSSPLRCNHSVTTRGMREAHSERISPRLAPLPARLPMSWSWDCLSGPQLLAEFRWGREESSAGPA